MPMLWEIRIFNPQHSGPCWGGAPFVCIGSLVYHAKSNIKFNDLLGGKAEFFFRFFHFFLNKIYTINPNYPQKSQSFVRTIWGGGVQYDQNLTKVENAWVKYLYIA